jgi:DNA-directed RNA polymerase specialized sigma24 family protein
VENELVAIYAKIRSECAFAGLTRSDADDVSQDICEWLVRSGKLPSAAIPAWLGAVTFNFIRRHWRRRSRESRGAVQLDTLTFMADDLCQEVASQTKLFLDRLASRSRKAEQGLLKLMRLGLTLSEASHKMGFPDGSQQFHFLRLRAEADRLGARPTRST